MLEKCRYQHFIFDFDDTLFDTKKGMDYCYSEAFKRVGIQYDDANLKIYMGESLESTFMRFRPDMAGYDIFLSTFITCSNENMADLSEPFDETVPFIKLLKKAGTRCSIVSGKSVISIQRVLSKYGLLEYFDDIIGFESVTHQKPDPEGLTECIKRSSIDASRTIYIGDSDIDRETAQKASVDCAIVNHGSEHTVTFHDLFPLCRLHMTSVISCPHGFFQWMSLKKDELERKLQIGFDTNKDIIIFSHGSSRYKLYKDDILVAQSDGELSAITKTLVDDKDLFHEKLKTDLFAQGSFIDSVKKEQFVGPSASDRFEMQYSVVCYNLLGNMDDIVNNYSSELSLMLLKNDMPDFDAIEDIEKENGEVVELSKSDHFFCIWGSRVFITDGRESVMFKGYCDIESDIQHLWYLLFSLNGRLEKQSDDLSLIEQTDVLDEIYRIQSSISSFKYLEAKTTHRYLLRIQKSLVHVSNIDVMYDYCVDKADNLSKRIDVVSTKNRERRENTLNMILFILTIVSTISSIFAVSEFIIKNDINVVLVSSAISSVIVLFCIIMLRGRK